MGRVPPGLGLHKEAARPASIRYKKPPLKWHSMRLTIDDFCDILLIYDVSD